MADDFTLVIASLGEVAAHAHAVPAVVAAVEGGIAFGFDGTWVEAEARFVPSDVNHRLECGAIKVAVLYWTSPLKLMGCPPPLKEVTAILQAAGKEKIRPAVALDAIRAAIPSHGVRRIDSRVSEAVCALRSGEQRLQRLETMAEKLRLSPSRLTHLFRHEVGIPFAKVRAWERMRSVVVHRAAGENLTMASLAAGFADSSHFSKAFRLMFGISASVVLHKDAEITVEVGSDS